MCGAPIHEVDRLIDVAWYPSEQHCDSAWLPILYHVSTATPLLFVCHLSQSVGLVFEVASFTGVPIRRTKIPCPRTDLKEDTRWLRNLC